jgi:hypothetical protein
MQVLGWIMIGLAISCGVAMVVAPILAMNSKRYEKLE